MPPSLPPRRWFVAARVVAILATGALLVLALRRLDLPRVVTSLNQVHASWIALAGLCYLAILPLWAAQWMLLAPSRTRPSLSRMLGVVSMTSSVLNTTPLLVGEASAVVFLVTYAGLGRSVAVSILAMDQLLVGIAKVGVLTTASLLLPLPSWAARGLVLLGATVAVALVALVAVAGRASAIDRLASRFALPPYIRSGAAGALRALAPLRSARLGGGALLLALAKKAMEIAAIACVQRAFGLSLPLASAVLVLAALNLSTLIPVVPGNIGVFEGTVVLTYAQFGVPPERALAVAVVQHACYFASLALPGYGWLARAGPRSVEAAS